MFLLSCDLRIVPLGKPLLCCSLSASGSDLKKVHIALKILWEKRGRLMDLFMHEFSHFSNLFKIPTFHTLTWSDHPDFQENDIISFSVTIRKEEGLVTATDWYINVKRNFSIFLFSFVCIVKTVELRCSFLKAWRWMGKYHDSYLLRVVLFEATVEVLVNAFLVWVAKLILMRAGRRSTSIWYKNDMVVGLTYALLPFGIQSNAGDG